MPIEKFNIKAFDPDTGNSVSLQAVHSGALSERKGYTGNFLGKEVPLPSVSKQVKKNIAVATKDIGSKDDGYKIVCT